MFFNAGLITTLKYPICRAIKLMSVVGKRSSLCRLKASPRRANREDGERGADLKLPASSMYKFEGVEDDESTNGNGDPTSLATSDSYHNDRRVQNGWSSSNGGVATLRASSDDAWMNGRSKCVPFFNLISPSSTFSLLFPFFF